MAKSRPRFVDTKPSDFFIKWTSKINTFMYRRSDGEGFGSNVQGIPVALLTTTGRKSASRASARSISTATATPRWWPRPRAAVKRTRCGI